jgi:hypothetical protein
MKEFLRKLLAGDGVSPTELCLRTFNQNFEDAINVEWFEKENNYEAIFYRNNLEHIALFTLTGFLEEYRLNIPANYLPEHIKILVSSRGEIMSSVMRNKGNMVEYEVIIRDKELNRHLITLSDMGKALEEKKL